MARGKRSAWFAALALAAGCNYQFNQCTKDADCPTMGGQKLYCTPDNLCVMGTPTNKLCNIVYPDHPPPDAVPLGVIMRLSLSAGSDEYLYKAVQLGVDEVNSFAGAGQSTVMLNVCDSSNDPVDAAKAMEVLTRERQVVAVVGPSTSREVLSVAKEAGDAHVPVISPSATAASLADLMQKNYVFKIAPSDNQQGPVLAHLVSGTKVALIYVDDAYGSGLQGAFSANIATSSLKLVQSFKEGAPMDAANAVLAMGSALTDAVVIANTDAKALVQQLLMLPVPDAMGKGGVRILMTDGAKNDDLLALALANKGDPTWTAHFARLSGTSPTVAMDGTFDAFNSAYQGHFMLPPTADAFAPYAYDAFYAVAIALGYGKGTATGPLLSTGLQHITGGGALTPVGPTNYPAAVAKMAMGQDVPLDGVSGPIRFQNGDRQSGLFEQWHVDLTDPNNPHFTSQMAQ